MTSFEDECVSLGLSVQKDGMKSILDNEKGEEIHDCLFAVAPNNDHDTTFYCASNLSGDERSVIMNSKFEPDMKNSTKTVFLVKKKDESHHNDYNLDENCSSDSNKNADDDDVAREILEYGRLADNKALSSVFVLDNVVLPLLRQGILSKKSIQESNLRSSLHLTYAKKFASRVCRFTEQYERGTRLVVPDNLDMTSFNELREEFSDLKSLEKAAIEWIASIAHVMESEINQPLQKDVKGPMAEVDFWRRRHVVFSDILEQVKNVKIKSSLEVLRVAGSPVCGKLQEKVNDLTKLSVEATENAKFLSTLERHLRTLNDGTLDAIIPTIPSLVDGMRMVWSVSRHYNRDERMVPLMEMVANQVILRVKERVKLHEIMLNQIDESRDVVSKSKKVLKIWRSSYMETRARIEKMGPGQRRWEFDRTRLFEITDYMADICTDVLQVIETIDELKHFLGPDLVSITGENGRVFTVMEEVKLLPKLFKDFQLDPFERSNGKDWSKIMETFNKMVQSIEEDAGESIQTAFRQLRSSVGAYHLVQQFGYMKSRPSIHRIIEQRYQDIFQQYEKESEQIEDYFLKYKDDPPISTGHQKAPGSIAWADGLYLRAKRPILLFQKHGSLLNDGLGLKVKNNYLKFARSIDSYKEHVYHNWQERARLVSYQCLRRPLLKVLGDDQSEANSQRTGSTKTCLHQPSDNTMPSSIQVPSDYSMQLNSHEKHSNSVSTVSVSTRIQTNFSNSVRILIDETKHFDAMGYSVPEGAMHLTLQEQSFNW
jgi:dynein heavy chain